MPPKQRTAFCSVPAYLNAKHPDLYTVFDSICELDLLSRGNVTLIIPPNADKLVDEIWKDDDEVIRDLRNRVLAHVLYGVHKDIGTSKEANTRQEVPRAVKLIKKGDSIVIHSGEKGKTVATVEPAKDFVDSSARGNIDVWVITSGQIAADGPAVDIRKRGPAKSGGSSDDDVKSAKMRTEIVADVLRSAAKGGAREAYCSASRGLICHIHHANPETCYQFILPRMANTYLDLFFLLQPFKPVGESYTVPNEYVESWYAAGCPPASFGEYAAVIDAATKSGIDALIYKCGTGASNSQDYPLSRAIAAIGTEVVGKSTINDIVGAISAVYEQLENENTLPGIKGQVFPEKPVNKLDEDDLRFWVDINLTAHYASRDTQGVDAIIKLIRDFMMGASSYTRNIVNKTTSRDMIIPTERTSLVRGFVKSIFFLEYPLSKAQLSAVSNYQTPSFNKREDAGKTESFYNPLLPYVTEGSAQRRGGYGLTRSSAAPAAAAAAAPSRERFGAALRRQGVNLTEEQLEAAYREW